jgi:hypothetical protein
MFFLLAMSSWRAIPHAHAQEEAPTTTQTVMKLFNGCLLHITGKPFPEIAEEWALTAVKRDSSRSLSRDKAAWTSPTPEGRVLIVEPLFKGACYVRLMGAASQEARDYLETALVRPSASGKALFSLRKRETADPVSTHYYVAQGATEDVEVRANVTFRNDAPKEPEVVTLEIAVVAMKKDAPETAIAP